MEIAGREIEGGAAVRGTKRRREIDKGNIRFPRAIAQTAANSHGRIFKVDLVVSGRINKEESGAALRAIAVHVAEHEKIIADACFDGRGQRLTENLEPGVLRTIQRRVLFMIERAGDVVTVVRQRWPAGAARCLVALFPPQRAIECPFTERG
jgi:hypothetical protein